MIKWFELRNAPPFILNKKHSPSGFQKNLWPGGTHSAKERYGASDARFLQYVHPQNLGLSEDFAYLSAALELANTFGTSVVPWTGCTLGPWGWAFYSRVILVDAILEFFLIQWPQLCSDDVYFANIAKNHSVYFFSPPDCNLMENFEFSIQMLPSTPRKPQLR